MRPEQPRIESYAADPLGDEAGILAGRHAEGRSAMAAEQELAGSFAGDLQIIIDRLAGLLAQFKSNRPAGFLLPDRCAIRRVSACGDVFDSDGDDITATELTVDCQIEHGEVASATFDLEFFRIDQTCLGRSGGFAPVSLPLFHGTRLGAGFAFN